MRRRGEGSKLINTRCAVGRGGYERHDQGCAVGYIHHALTDAIHENMLWWAYGEPMREDRGRNQLGATTRDCIFPVTNPVDRHRLTPF
jgi:hypothetical protein